MSSYNDWLLWKSSLKNSDSLIEAGTPITYKVIDIPEQICHGFVTFKIGAFVDDVYIAQLTRNVSLKVTPDMSGVVDEVLSGSPSDSTFNSFLDITLKSYEARCNMQEVYSG